MKIIIGNWKMNGTRKQKSTMIQSLSKTKSKNTVVLCLPFTLLNGVTHGVKIGAQNISEHDNGAYTGDISGKMIAETGAKYVIVGHSDRRYYHHETNKIVHNKAVAAIKNNLIPIICVGETLDEYKSEKTFEVIKKMLNTCLPRTGDFIVAYEPRWAIGTGKTPTTKEIKDIHKMIYKHLVDKGYKNTPIVYGGSINLANASKIASIPHVDGLLIGKASLEIKTFLPIIKSIK